MVKIIIGLLGYVKCTYIHTYIPSIGAVGRVSVCGEAWLEFAFRALLLSKPRAPRQHRPQTSSVVRYGMV